MGKTKTRAYIRAEVSGGKVFDALADAPPDGMTHREIAKESGLTPSQVETGLRYLREVLTEWAHSEDKDTEVLCHNYQTHKYYFADQIEDARVYLEARIMRLRTWVVNLMTGTAEPAVVKFGGSAIKRLRKDLTRASEDLDEMLELLGTPMSAAKS